MSRSSPRSGARGCALADQQIAPTGTLFAVVGPSGAGKDTLMDHSRQLLAQNKTWCFARRHITRGINAGGERHIETDRDEFAALVRQNAFVLHWQAHELRYGIARGYQDLVHNGVNVVVNLSRSVLEDAVKNFTHIHVIHVTASPLVLSTRLAKRARETPADIQQRIDRGAMILSTTAPITQVVNDHTIAEGVEIFMAALKGQNAQAA